MVREKLKVALSGIYEKIQASELSIAQKKQCIRIFRLPVNFVKDNRLRQSMLMQELFNQDIKVYPGMAIDLEIQELLFLKMNFCKMKIFNLKKRILNAGSFSLNQIKQLLKWNTLRMAINSKIVTANMGLVMAMARYVNYAGVEFTELVSDGGITLMRATDKFDYTRGCKFSTYACRAILRTMSRTARIWYRHRKMFPAQLEPDWEKVDLIDHRNEQEFEEMIEEIKVILDHNLANLTETEQAVIRLRFPFLDDEAERVTLKEAGLIIGLSKERIRQIQNKSLTKLRTTMQQRITF